MAASGATEKKHPNKNKVQTTYSLPLRNDTVNTGCASEMKVSIRLKLTSCSFGQFCVWWCMFHAGDGNMQTL